MIIKFNTAIYFNSIKKNHILHLMYYIQNVTILENLKPSQMLCNYIIK